MRMGAAHVARGGPSQHGLKVWRSRTLNHSFPYPLRSYVLPSVDGAGHINNANGELRKEKERLQADARTSHCAVCVVESSDFCGSNPAAGLEVCVRMQRSKTRLKRSHNRGRVPRLR